MKFQNFHLKLLHILLFQEAIRSFDLFHSKHNYTDFKLTISMNICLLEIDFKYLLYNLKNRIVIRNIIIKKFNFKNITK